MNRNRSIPDAVVIPVLAYPDVDAAVRWLERAFGFAERLRIGDHRAQLVVEGGGAVVVRQGDAAGAGAAHSIMVRVADAQAHHARAVAHGARVAAPPEDYPYGERQYTALDLAGHAWTFTQSIADVHPADWGGALRESPDPLDD